MVDAPEGYKQQWAFHTCYAHEIDWQDEQKLNLVSKIIFYYSNNYQNSYFHVFQHWRVVIGILSRWLICSGVAWLDSLEEIYPRLHDAWVNALNTSVRLEIFLRPAEDIFFAEVFLIETLSLSKHLSRSGDLAEESYNISMVINASWNGRTTCSPPCSPGWAKSSVSGSGKEWYPLFVQSIEKSSFWISRRDGLAEEPIFTTFWWFKWFQILIFVLEILILMPNKFTCVDWVVLPPFPHRGGDVDVVESRRKDDFSSSSCSNS